MRNWLRNLVAPMAIGLGVGAATVAADPLATDRGKPDAQPSAERQSNDQSNRATQVERGPRETYLGIVTEPVSPALAAQFPEQLGPDEGLVIKYVLPDSPASRDGLKQFDLIVTYNGQRLTSTRQLKELITADRPGESVKLEIIRSARPQSMVLTLDERDVPAFASERQLLQWRLDLSDLMQRPAGSQPGARSNADALSKADAVSTNRPTESRSLALTIQSDRLHIQYRDEAGKAREQRFQGTHEQIDRQLKELPPSLAEDVRRLWKRVRREKTDKCAFQFRLRPITIGSRKFLRILLWRPEQDGTLHLFELEYPLGNSDQLDPDELLQIKEVAQQLDQLAPAVREQIRNTLQRIPVPKARVRPKRSL